MKRFSHLLRFRTFVLAAVLWAVAPTAATAFDLQGHRGARGLAPENTIAAFRRALEIGVTTLETDLAATSDGHLVLAHDHTLNPALVRENGRWLAQPGPAIRSLTLAALRGYDVGRLNPDSPYARQWREQQPADGETIPTLAELFALLRSGAKPTRLNLETKITPSSGSETPDPASFAALVVAAVRGAGFADRATIQSFDWRTLVEIRRIAPEIELACLTIRTGNFDTVKPGADGASPWHAGLRAADHGDSVPGLAKAAGCATWAMFWRNLTPDLVAEAKSLGLKVLPWTVNEPADMTRLIEWGVDGIITDYPDRLRRVMAERSMKLP
ncbi:MAG: glycerophosphodiester phosphodiesterase [Burkholderiaceae bacterium]|nr:glycerophosphodiester phosphodiesterase [Burkholderiaceae bacterium]